MPHIFLAMGLFLSLALVAVPVHAVDCYISFDQRCLSRPYDDRQVEHNHLARQQQMNQATRETEKVALAWTAARKKQAQELREQVLAVQEAPPEQEQFSIGVRIPNVGPMQRFLGLRTFP